MENKKIFWLLIVLVILFRFVLIFLPGISWDLRVHQKWSENVLKYGPFSLYQNPQSPNLPPLWVYWLGFFTLFFYLIFRSSLTAWTLKIPAVLADFWTAYLIFYFLKRKVGQEKAFWFGFIYFLHPFILYNSSIWGQWDSLFVLFLIIALIFLDKKQPLLSLIFLTISFLTKLQAVIFFPLFLFFIWQNYGLKILSFSLLVAVSLFFVLVSPLLINGLSLISLFEKTWLASARMSPALSMNAFNLWWIPQVMIGLGRNFIKDDTVFVGPFSYGCIGFILFGLSYFLVLLWLRKNKGEFNCFLFGNLFIAFIFYFLPTAMHERYIFPFFTIFCLILPFRKELKRIFLIVSLTAFLNLIYSLPLTFLNLDWQNKIRNLAGEFSILISLIHLAVFFYFLIYFLYEKNSSCLANLQRRKGC
ncbi:MAG: glycosyltransferase family 39 protein [Patescibacteria group bacterium]|nr:glycosyltransferase family 39 protein [Patescibacteria group bacterium]